MNRTINVILIILGGIVALYAQAQEKQNSVILILGIVILMIGVYRTSRHIPSKTYEEDQQENTKD